MTNLMVSIIVFLLTFFAAISLGLIGMMWGWGLEPKSWGWVAFSYLGLMITTAVLQHFKSELERNDK